MIDSASSKKIDLKRRVCFRIVSSNLLLIFIFRIPIQVKMTVKDLKKEFDQAVNNAYMVITGKGSCR